MQDLMLSSSYPPATLVSAVVVFSAWPNIKKRIGDYHTAHDEAGRKD
jgi:hypothetical protein